MSKNKPSLVPLFIIIAGLGLVAFVVFGASGSISGGSDKSLIICKVKVNAGVITPSMNEPICSSSSCSFFDQFAFVQGGLFGATGTVEMSASDKTATTAYKIGPGINSAQTVTIKLCTADYSGTMTLYDQNSNTLDTKDWSA